MEQLVTHRFIYYDFVLRTTLNPVRCAELLASNFREPNPGVFGALTTEVSRISGRFDGMVFAAHFHRGIFGGYPAPGIEGFVSPSETGADLVVRVRLSAFFWTSFAILFAIFALELTIGAKEFWCSLAQVALLLFVWVTAVTSYLVLEGRRARKQFSAWLAVA